MCLLCVVGVFQTSILLKISVSIGGCHEMNNSSSQKANTRHVLLQKVVAVTVKTYFLESHPTKCSHLGSFPDGALSKV